MPVRQKPPTPFIRTGALLASTAAAGFGVVLASGVSQAVTTTPAHQLAEVRPVQLWETHQWHLNHMTHLARTSGGVVLAARPGDTEPDGDSDDPTSSAVSVGAGSVSAAPGSFQACVIARESGGQSQVMNSTGHYGLYQFDEQTWVSGGGSAATFGHASVAEQNSVFSAVYAARGNQPWTPSDGC